MTKAQKMFELVDQYHNGGKTRKEFCTGHNLKESTFAYWITRRRKADQPQGGFTALDISQPSTCNESVELIYPNGIRVVVPAGDLVAVTRLIRLY